MVSILKYKDEADKSLGIAGMAISLVACDGEEYLAAVSLRPGEEAVDMSPDFYFCSTGRYSAKIAWNELLRQYQTAMAMLVGNVLCRSVVGQGRTPAADVVDALREIARTEGADSCQLELDEADSLFNKHYAYYSRLFNHPGVMSVADEFAGTLRRLRYMTGGDVVEALRRLNSL